MYSKLSSHLLHGADYNPEQWRDYAAIHTPGEKLWDEDMRLMKAAHMNCVSIGIFSWVSLEPEEGRFEWGWMDEIIERLHANGQRIFLATPSGAKPAWMSQKYPEIRRVLPDGRREPHRARHNHCQTSPVYREKLRIINTELARRYGRHPALALWHISNEYSGACYCSLCLDAFRDWLRARYGDLDTLNNAWWSRFWSHTYTDWSQIEPFDEGVHGLSLDWKRFTSDQTVDFMRAEIAPLREISPGVPVTTNMMGVFSGLNYWKFAPHLDFMSWDSYPAWRGDSADLDVACETAFTHDIYRSFKGGQPFLLMESTPSLVNWQPVSRPMRPGMQRLSSLQAVAHGADSVCYFQFRASRGSSEKFHGAVVGHSGDENNRIFRQIATLGEELERLEGITGTSVRPEAAVICDWENRWAIEAAQGPRNKDKNYIETCQAHYRPLWRLGIPTDVIESIADFSPYRLLVAPMLYMLRPGVTERLVEWVRGGGTLVTTYLSGIADENDLCFLGGFPGPLREVLGIWAEETDVLHENQGQSVLAETDNACGLNGSYAARHLCEILHAETAEVLATYADEFYAGSPAVTVNQFGAGRAFYIASRNDDRFADDLLGGLIASLNLKSAWPAPLPAGVSATRRGETVFLMNFNGHAVAVQSGETRFTDVAGGETVHGAIELSPYDCRVLRQSAS